MKQVAQNYRSGELRVLDVPPPACRPGGVIVRSTYSLVSTGTELMKVAEAGMSLLGKARARPDQVRKLLDTMSRQGVASTYAKAMQRLDSYTPLGYSLCGTVEWVGSGVEGLHVGQRVACAGNEFALHAELNWVPRRLCVPVPDGVDSRLAAFATVGAIALHGVRRCEAQLGDTACVVGLGLVGQLVVQLLVASGVRVVGIDVVAERCRLAEKAGAACCAAPDAEGLERVERSLVGLTGGLGADHVVLVAGGASNGPVEAAARLARDRANVVDIGKLSLNLPWNAYYDKELDVRFSRSYGPGRYDESYELAGVDYPAGYIRWTEQRNIECFVDLLARGELAVELLATETFPVEEAPQVYARLASGSLHGVGVLFSYPAAVQAQDASTDQPSLVSSHKATTPLGVRSTATSSRAKLRLGFVGAGNYASSVLLPTLAARDDVVLARVATQTSLSAANARRRFGFAEAITDADGVLEADDLDAVFIVTRHHSHADLVCRSLEAGNATFVEKPLAIGDEELARVVEAVRASGNDRLMVGFNRRFAPLLVELKRRFGVAATPVVRYLVNAGPLTKGSWYGDEAQAGSRFVGEGGHFLDTVGWWLEARPVEVRAQSPKGRDDLHVTVRYVDGSVASIDYVTEGSPRYPKETIEVFAEGRTARFDNFRRATLWRGRRRVRRRTFGAPDKGQDRQLECFLGALRTTAPMPITFDSLVATTAATLAAERSRQTGTAVAL